MDSEEGVASKMSPAASSSQASTMAPSTSSACASPASTMMWSPSERESERWSSEAAKLFDSAEIRQFMEKWGSTCEFQRYTDWLREFRQEVQEEINKKGALLKLIDNKIWKRTQQKWNRTTDVAPINLNFE
jgi:hypothetical protein